MVEVEDSRILSMLMQIQKELAELRGEIKGISGLTAKINESDERSRRSEILSLENSRELEELKIDLEHHKENQSRREEKAQADRVSTRRWLITTIITVVGLIVATLFNIL